MGFTSTMKRERTFVTVDGFITINDRPPAHRLQNFGGLINQTTSYRSGRGYDNDSATLTNAQIASEYLGDNANHVLYPFDTGHPFETNDMKMRTKLRTLHIKTVSSGFDISFDGQYALSCALPDQAWFDLPSLDLVPLGTKAIKLTNPIRPTASLAEFLAQMKTGQELPVVPGITHDAKFAFDFNLLLGNNLQDTIARYLQIGGNGYLNLAFGWTPFIHDIIALSNAVLQSSKIVNQMLRDSGRSVRRAYRFPTTTESTIIQDNIDIRENNISLIGAGIMGGDPFGNNFVVADGQVSTVDSISTEQWFSGAYTYKLANADSLGGRFLLYAQLAQKLVGPGITPAVLWDLTPWSWLADWIADIGDIFSNAADFGQDGLVLRYGYMMSKQTKRRTSIASGIRLIDGQQMWPMSVTFESSRKQRIRATPYGFGLDTSQFTVAQWAILAALGMTRGGNQLRNNDNIEPE